MEIKYSNNMAGKGVIGEWAILFFVLLSLATLQTNGVVAQPILENYYLEALLVQADLVIFGKVATIEPPPRLHQSGSRTESSNQFWQQAVIDISTVLKGCFSPKRITVLFPKGMTVQFPYASIRVGQEGVWILQLTPKDQAQYLPAYVVPVPFGFQPKDQLYRIQSLIKQSK